MICENCKVPKDWKGDDRKCAFNGSRFFLKENWNCGTMNKLRSIAEMESRHFRMGDEFLDVIHVGCDEGFIVLTGYKSRGSVGRAHFMTDEKRQRLTLKKALQAIAAFESIRGYKC